MVYHSYVFGVCHVSVGGMLYMNYCSCGCGTVIADDKRFVRGHAARMKTHPFYGGFMKGKKYSPNHLKAMCASRIGKSLNYPSTTIDWDWLISAYNRRYGTEFNNEKELYLGVYPELSPQQIADRLGVCDTTIRRRMDMLGVERSHTNGGSNNTKAPKRNAFLAIPVTKMAGMTLKEISRETRADPGYCGQLARQYGRVYKNMRSRKDV